MKFTTTVPTKLIPFIAMLSGSCGLAYEIIYARLFSNYFGNSFVMSGIILTAVFFGIAFGAWQSNRFIKSLAWIELSLGVYAFISATLFTYWGFSIANFQASVFINSVKLIFFLGMPTFLIGTCIPLFTAYIKEHFPKKKGAFVYVYSLYNFGAFISILTIEFILFRFLGLQITSYIIGCLNFIIAVFLFNTDAPRVSKNASKQRLNLNKRIILALLLISFVSGIFQLYVLRLSFDIFGPLQENFAIILISAILGVSIGAVLSAKHVLSFSNALLSIVFGHMIFMCLLSLIITLWGIIGDAGYNDFNEGSLKIILLAGYPFGMFVLFGSLVPLALQEQNMDNEERVSAKLLAISSLGNGLGALIMFCVLFQSFSYLQISALMLVVTFASYLLIAMRTIRLPQLIGSLVIIVCLGVNNLQLWPHVDLFLGYRTLASYQDTKFRREAFKDAVTYKAYDQSASIVAYDDDTRSLVFNGYRSLTFGPSSKSELREVIVGATPILFSKKTEKALVFGLGTGITSGATARVYEDTKVVEINPAIFKIPFHFEQANHNIMKRQNVEIMQEDGISTLLRNETTYDAIVNTVTSPQYYAASKLYTADFYEIVKTRLSDGGVYSSWFDLNIDREGVSIMLNTLERSFDNCRYFVLASSYFNAVCSVDALTYLSSREIKTRTKQTDFNDLLNLYNLPNGFGDTMAALEVSFDADFLTRVSTKLNTLNLPAIEFVVARNSDRAVTADMLSKTIAANIDFQRRSSFGYSDWRFSCQTIAQMSDLKFKGCLK